MLPEDQELFTRTYDAFNARDIDAVIATLHPEVTWPNGWEGGWVHGHAAVRDYWTRQWAVIDPHVDPVAFAIDERGRIVVTVHQVVRDLQGQVLSESTVEHVYTLDDGLITHMEIRDP